MEKHPIAINYKDFQATIKLFFDEISKLDDVNLNDLELANYNLLKEIDDIYKGYCTLYNHNEIENLPSLTRILFERLMYLLYINHDTEEPKELRAKRYLDRTVYDTQVFNKYIYDESPDTNSKKIREHFDIELYDPFFELQYNLHLLEKAKKEYELNFQEVEKIKSHKWYEYTDKFTKNKKGEFKAVKLYNFKDLCDYFDDYFDDNIDYSVYYHICYKNFSSDIHTAASSREEIRNSLRTNTALKKPSYYNLSIALTNIIMIKIFNAIK